MRHFLTIIRKSEFTDLFKYGYQHINANTVVEFDGDLKGLENNSEIKDKLFSNVNPFDYTFTIVVIHFQSSLETPNMVYIEDVQHIFPLDNDAKREIEISFDPRIRIEAPLWCTQVHELQEQFLYESSKKGTLNIWQSLRVEDDMNNFCSILTDDEIKELVHEAFIGSRPKGPHSFWIYLIRYERHGHFRKTSVGYFYDLVNVYINFLKMEEQPYEKIEVTDIYKILESISDQASTKIILQELQESTIGQNFIKTVNECTSINADVVKTAILFLVFKNTFADGFILNDDSRKVIEQAKEYFPKEFGYALFMLGIFLGHDHTFECLYDQMPLPIFKTSTKATTTLSDNQKESGDEDGNEAPPFQDKDGKDSQENVLSDDNAPSEDNKRINEPSSNSDDKTVEQVETSAETESESCLSEGKLTSNEVGQVSQDLTKMSIKSSSQQSLFKDDETLNEPEMRFPVKMRKKGNRGRPKTVKNEIEYIQLKEQGYYETDK